MKALKSTGYHKPRYIHALGEDGLYSREIASALGINHFHVLEKLRRVNKDQWKQRGWNLIVSTIKSGKVGRPFVVWILNTAAAKVFVARWENEIGDGYLNFLFACEREVTEMMPNLQAELVETKERLNRAESGALKLPKKSTVIWPVGYHSQTSLFGDTVHVPHFAQIDKAKLTPKEQRLAKSQHMTRVLEGVSKAKKKIEDEEIIENLPPLWRP